jgi:hypothetical protein
MILLRPDCLVFKLASGDSVPCPVEDITVEVIGEAVKLLDEHVVQNAAEAVLHYFRVEQGRTVVTLGEFTEVLETVLRRLGLDVRGDDPPDQAQEPRRVLETDLRLLASESGKAFELVFFPRLREELKGKLGQAPQVVRFSGLRGCVKQLVGARRWSGRCQYLNDQIVDYLRTCLENERQESSCALVVQ